MHSSLGCGMAPGGWIWNLDGLIVERMLQNGKSSTEGKLIALSHIQMHKDVVEEPNPCFGGNYRNCQ